MQIPQFGIAFPQLQAQPSKGMTPTQMPQAPQMPQVQNHMMPIAPNYNMQPQRMRIAQMLGDRGLRR